MGITLHAIVERLVPANEYCATDRWVEVGKWDDFGKHFALKEWLYEHAEKGWPKDSHADEYEENEILDVWRGWTTTGEVEAALMAIRAQARSEPLVYVECLAALMAALEVYDDAGYRLRVLWGTC